MIALKIYIIYVKTGSIITEEYTVPKFHVDITLIIFDFSSNINIQKKDSAV